MAIHFSLKRKLDVSLPILQTKVNKIKAVKILTRICSTDAMGKIIVW